ncbi:hypothetical protein MD484_g6525, partial [Candolleomyces efflorescens]
MQRRLPSSQPSPALQAPPSGAAGPLCTLFITRAVIKSDQGSGATQDRWLKLRLLLGEGVLILNRSAPGQWEGRGHVKITGGNGRLSIGHFFNSTVLEIGYISVGGGIQAKYVGPEKHQYRFDSKIIRVGSGPILELSCDLYMSLPAGTQYPVERHQQAAAAANTDALLLLLLAVKGEVALNRYNQSHNLSDLDQAISAYTEVLKILPSDHPSFNTRRGALGLAMFSRFEHTGYTFLCRATGQVQFADRSVETLEKAIELSLNPRGSGLTLGYRSLGVALTVRFEAGRKIGDLVRAVEVFKTGIAAASDGDSMLVDLYLDFGNPLSLLYEQTGDVAFLDKSLEMRKKGLDIASPGHHSLRHGYANLGHGYYTRFKRTAKPQDIEDAVAALKRALEGTPEGHSTLPHFLSLLANALHARFTHFKDVKDINEAVSLQQRAVELSPPDLSTHLSVINQDLGTTLLSRFGYTGDIRDVERAIIALQKAVDSCPPGHMHLPSIYNNLGIALSTRFPRTGELQFADRAVEAQRKAISLAPLNITYQRLPSFYNDLGSTLIMRFEKTDNREDLTEAITAFQKAVELSPVGHAWLPGWYGSLADALATRSQNGGGMADIDEAIRTHEKVVKLTTEKGRNPFSRYIQGGDLRMDRFRLSKEQQDLTSALSSYETALRLIPQGYSYRSALHTRYASALIRQFQLTNDQAHFDSALEHYKLAAQLTGCSPLTRFAAGREWARFAVVANSPEAMEAFQICVDLLPLAAGLDKTLDRRHYTLKWISDLSREAASYALSRGEPKTAVEWLEASRCLVWGQINSLRTPLDELRGYDEELATRFAAVSAKLEKSGTRKGPYDVGTSDVDMKTTISLQQEAVLHVELAAEYSALLETIRAAPGLDRFLKAPSFDSLVGNLPISGYTVLVNVYGDHCDAICTSRSRDEPLHVRLPDFSFDKAEELRKRLHDVVNSFGMRMRGDRPAEGEKPKRVLIPFRRKKTVEDGKAGLVPAVLRELWLYVAKPIIDALGLKGSESDQKDRIWWCLTGPLAFLPIHAAGIYKTSTTEENVAVSDFVISSYIPTLTSLAKASNSAPPRREYAPRQVNRFLLVSQPETKGFCPLPGAMKEVESVKKALDARSIPNLTLSASSAIVKTTLTQIRAHNWLHFACHAYQDVANPLNSGFILSDGKLVLSEITKLGMKGAEFAYLSACQRSTGDEELSEEAVHLAAGMLAAGFKGVVATMWSIRDQDAPEMAKDFYGYILSHSHPRDGIDSSLAATWIPYVHFGA